LPGFGAATAFAFGAATAGFGFAAVFTGLVATFAGFALGAGPGAALLDGPGNLRPFGAGFAAADLEADLAAKDLTGEDLAGRRERSDFVDFTMTGSAFLSGHKACAPPPGNPAFRGVSMDEAEPGDPHNDQVDGNDVVEELRHDEDQDSGNQRHDRLNVGNGEHLGTLLQEFGEPNGMGVTPYAKLPYAPC
jgi:hypothetical protein